MSTYTLTDEQADVIAHALKQCQLFDGPGSCPDYDTAADALVALGYGDPRKDDDE